MDLALSQINRKIKLAAGDTYEHYAWCRRKAEYIMRLMFAVTVDVVLVTRTVDMTTVFNKDKVRDCTMGAMVYTANGLLAQLPASMRTAEIDMLLEVWNVLDNIRILRNDDAHDGTPAKDLEQFIWDNENWFQQLEAMTCGRYFQLSHGSESSYQQNLLYVRDEPQEDGTIPCFSVSSGGDIMLHEHHLDDYDLSRGVDVLQGQLYLQVHETARLQERCYRLSPFILWEDEKLLLYQTMLQSLNHGINLKYITLLRKKGVEQRYCPLLSLVPQGRKGPYFVYFTRSLEGKKSLEIEINLRDTNDNGTQRLANKDSNYCDTICPQRKDALDHCLNRTNRYCVICGEGGLGKTALVLNIINAYIIEGRTDYKRVIFLSAKKFYPEYDRPISYQTEAEKQVTPDFSSYHDFLVRLFELLLYRDKQRTEQYSDRELEDRLLKKINVERGIPEALLLVIDDLDSLRRADQEQVVSFINQITNEKTFALITTRREDTSGPRIQLTRLDARGCTNFLTWYLNLHNKNVENFINPNGDFLLRITEGRPYDLQHWANLLLRRGRSIDESDEEIFRQLLTPKQRTDYLCRTSLRQLDKKEQLLFCFLCEMNTALCSLEAGKEADEETEKKTRENISFRLLLYLQMDGMQSSEHLRDALKLLRDVCLLESGSPEEPIIVRRKITYISLLEKEENLPPMPEYLKRILERIRQDPQAWKEERFLNTLLQYLYAWVYAQKGIDLEKLQELRIVQRIKEEGDRGNLTGRQMEILKKIQTWEEKNGLSVVLKV